jgi:hypothetical protein
MTDPAVGAGVDVGLGGVTGHVGYASGGEWCAGDGAMGGDVPATDGWADGTRGCARAWMSGGTLGVGRKGKGQKCDEGENCQRSNELFHGFLRRKWYSVKGTAIQ